MRAFEGTTGLEVEVRNTGRGISAEAVPKLFERFYRHAAAADGGFGLGLAIVKRIIELHGGSATVQSEPGHAATVRLTYPPLGNENDTDVIRVPRW